MQHLHVELAAKPVKFHRTPEGDLSHYAMQNTPLGLPQLEGKDLERVGAASVIYDGLTSFLTECIARGIPMECENPTSSYLWMIPCFVALVSNTSCRFCNYDACAWGSTRKVKRSFLYTMPEMTGIKTVCPGNHEHAPFGRTRQPDSTFKYATSDAADYTAQLCLQIVSVVQNALNLPRQKIETDHHNLALIIKVPCRSNQLAVVCRL